MKYEIGQKVSFEEALAHMKEGGFCNFSHYNEEKLVFKIDRGNFYFYEAYYMRWTFSTANINVSLMNQWFIAKDPEKKEEPKEQVSEIIPSSFAILMVPPNENNFVQYNNFFKALTTFMRLKSHPLAMKAINGISQYNLEMNDSGTGIRMNEAWNIYVKLDFLSPCFSSCSDAEKAISNIGEENLIHMFKTFQGVK